MDRYRGKTNVGKRTIFLEIVPKNFLELFGKGDGAIKVLNNDNSENVFIVADENSVLVKENRMNLARNEYGEQITVNYKGNKTELLFPRDILIKESKNFGNVKIRTIRKEEQNWFFESNMIGEIYGETFTFSIKLNNINPDYFNPGEHIFLHCFNLFDRDEYDHEYIVVNKVVSYTKFKKFYV